ncbi:MAG: hypothetical protein V3S55_06335 [Nitrospiraceae bacterium]
MSIRKARCCVDCDAELYEIRQYFTSGPYAGHPMRFGPPLDGGLTITFLLMDGTLCDLSLCDECGPVVEDNLPRIWRKVMNSMVYEQEYGATAPPKTESEAVRRQEGYRQLNLHLVNNPPLGVLYTRTIKQKWDDRLL